ncbi:Uncharacterised protein [Yersinia kristensenii]|nr:Uncharacterised protein [Yersinia kristensenii]
MFGIISLFISFFGYASFMSLSLRRRWSEVLFYYISFSITFLYCFALFGHLKIGVISLCVLGVVLFIYQVYKGGFSLNYKEAAYIASFSIPFILLAILVRSGFIFTGWDEFSFWGSSVKLIHAEDSIYTESTPLSAFKNYPPAQQLWQYNILFFNEWSDRLVVVSHGIFILSCLAFSATRLNFTNKFTSLILFLSLIPLIYILGYDLSTIYVDQLIAVYFAATIILAMSAKDRIDFIFLCIAASNLIIIKQIGLVFSLFVVCLYFICKIFSDGVNFSNIKRNMLYTMFLFVVSLVTYKSWSLYVSSINYPSNTKIPSINEFNTSPLKEKVAGTLSEFYVRFFDTPFIHSSISYFRISMFETMIGLLVISIIVSFLYKKPERYKITTINSGMFLFGIAYIAFLLLCYISFFTEYESLKLASFERYSSTFILAWSIFIIAQIGVLVSTGEKLKPLIIPTIILISMTVASPESYKKQSSGIYPNKSKMSILSDINKATDLIKLNISNGERAYIIDQNTNGYTAVAFNYYMLPYKPFSWCWSLGEKYSNADKWTCDKTLHDVLKGVSYLYVYNPDKQFWDRNSKFFYDIYPDGGKGVYHVEWSGDGSLKIKTI